MHPENASPARRRLATFLLVCACLLAIPAVIGQWTDSQFLDTDNWVETSERLIEDEEIRRVVSEEIALSLTDLGLTEAGIPDDQLPDELRGRVGSLQERAIAYGVVALENEEVVDLWLALNRDAHRSLLDVIEERTPEGEIVLQFSSIRDELAGQLGLPAPNDGSGPTYVVASEDDYDRIRTPAQLVGPVSLVMGLLAIALIAIAIAITGGCRATYVARAGIVLIVTGLAAFGFRILGTLVAGQAFSDQDPPATDVWQIVTSRLVDIGFMLCVLGLLLLIGGIVARSSQRRRRRDLEEQQRYQPQAQGWY